jgi:hypothetical protein
LTKTIPDRPFCSPLLAFSLTTNVVHPFTSSTLALLIFCYHYTSSCMTFYTSSSLPSLPLPCLAFNVIDKRIILP